MKISFLIPSIRQGGAERQFVALANGLFQKGYAVEFITYKDNKCFYDLTGIDHIHIPKKIKIDLKFLRALVKYLKKNKSDIVFSCYQGRFEGPLLWARLVKPFYSSIKVISGYRSTIDLRSAIILDKMTQHLVSLSITNNPQALSALYSTIKVDKDKAIYIKNISIPENFFNLSKQNRQYQRSRFFPFKKEKYICGLLGSYSIPKNYSLMIDTIKYLHANDQIKDIFFAIFGDNKCDNSQYLHLSELVKENNLNDFISLNKSVENVNELINCFDVLILPSFNEGTPNVVLEALLCKVPVILSQGANNAGLIKHGYNGFVFETNDYQQLGDYILQMKQQPLIIDDGQVNILKNTHNRDKIVDEYIQCFESLIQHS
jgi:glycosyltransferase involved in cell wall biosynthesis